MEYKFYVQMDGDTFGPYSAKEILELDLMDDILVTGTVGRTYHNLNQTIDKVSYTATEGRDAYVMVPYKDKTSAHAYA